MDITGKVLPPCADIGTNQGWDITTGLASSSLLIHSDTTDGSTTFVDTVGTHSPVAGAADVEHDTDQARFGKTSILFDGDSGYITIPDHADWDFNGSAFTIDFWIRFASVATALGICQQYDDADNYVELWWESQGANANKLLFNTDGAGEGAMAIEGGWVPVANKWYHVAVIRGWGGVATTFALCIDGTAIVVDAVGNGAPPDMPNVGAAFEIGRRTRLSEYWMNGWIDEFRVSKGVARWTKNFIPPYGSYR